MDHKGNAVDEHFTIQDLKTAAMANTRDAEDVVITTTSGEIPDRNFANCVGMIIRKRRFPSEIVISCLMGSASRLNSKNITALFD